MKLLYIFIIKKISKKKIKNIQDKRLNLKLEIIL